LTLATVAAASGEEIMPFDLAGTGRSVFSAFAAARHKFGGKRVCIIDVDDSERTYDDIMRGTLALGSALRAGTKAGDCVGVMLPTGAGAIVAFLGLSAYGRIPAMLNFTSGAAAIKSAIKTAQVKRVVTAKRFVEMGGFQSLIADLSKTLEIVYLEDVREHLSLLDKISAAVGQYVPYLVSSHPDPDAMATVLFTSGTEGEPKGVALSHRNLVANVEQVRVHLALYPTDILLNPLPAFHCFGLTVGSIMPLLLGIKVVCHPTPLQPHEIVRRIKSHAATIVVSTDTFISQYARAAEPGDLKSLRLTVCGAERLRDETRAFLRKKHGIELLEGYGVTEASPVIAANRPQANRAGTVGQLMADMIYRLDPVEGIPNAGRLVVKGPNVMLGYIKADAPGVIDPPPEGWHDTGDVVSVDEDGFIAIKGRLKRFAKIGGETVSLAVVESIASALWPDDSHASVTIPDGRKGEQIVLVTTSKDGSRQDLIGWAHNHGVSELAVPRRIVNVDEIPVLGTGKTNYGAVQKIVEAALQPSGTVSAQPGAPAPLV
jgi:acyl-[acyl-carrier-protein]-phospholipid O-acyltransferase/long-chain-fatty-acid--[acyl-carrier-protein] ligase